MRALIPGRFQPFHLGHMYFIKKVLNLSDEIMIIVENSDESFTLRNPMTAGERIEMIHNVLINNFKEDIHRIMIFPMENIKNNAEWVSHLKSMIPKFDVCYSNNVLVKILMENEGIKVNGIDLLDRQKYSGTIIREKIAKGLEWKDLVPDEVYKFIVSRKIDERIIRLANENDNIIHG